MNLRYHNNQSTLIHRLAHQAHDETNVLYHERLKTESPAQVIFYDMFNQRFAELLLKNVSQFVEDKFDFCGDEITIAEKIREHYGVEE